MTPLWLVIIAECRRLSARPIARLSLVVSLLVMAGIVGLGITLDNTVQTGDGASVLEASTGASITGWVAVFRSLPIGLMLVALLGVGQSAGDLETSVLRDDLCRPVRRHDLVLGRWVALSLSSLFIHLIGFVLVAGASAAAFGTGGDWGTATLVWLGCWASDMAVGALALAAGFVGGGTLVAIAALFALATADTVAWIGTQALNLGIQLTVQVGGTPMDPRIPGWIASVLPHAAITAWSGEPFGATLAWLLWTGLGLTVATVRLGRRDVA